MRLRVGLVFYHLAQKVLQFAGMLQGRSFVQDTLGTKESPARTTWYQIAKDTVEKAFEREFTTVTNQTIDNVSLFFSPTLKLAEHLYLFGHAEVRRSAIRQTTRSTVIRDSLDAGSERIGDETSTRRLRRAPPPLQCRGGSR